MTAAPRLGQPAGAAAASFRCGACGEMAAVVKAVPAGQPVDMGPPLGLQRHKSDGIVVDYFFGTAWKLASATTYTQVREVLSDAAPDPAVLRKIEWELAPFYCPECGQNYCQADWHSYVLFDEGSYDCTMGTCPDGHKHVMDD